MDTAQDFRNFKRPAIFFAGGLGDHILNLPTFRALSALFPGSLRLLCMPDSPRLFFSDLQVQSFHEIPCEADYSKRNFDVEHAANELSGCDLFISLNIWHSDDMKKLIASLSPQVSVGFNPDFSRSLLLNKNIHAVDAAFSIALEFDDTLRLEDFCAAPFISARANEIASEILGCFPEGNQLLALHADTHITKHWPEERWIDILDAFLEAHEDFFVLVLGQLDFELDTGKFAERVIPCYGLPLDASMAVLSKANFFLGIDSCLLHAADFFRVPGVGIFGTTGSARWGFRFAPHHHLDGHDSMEKVAVLDVLDALEDLVRENAVASK